MTNNLKKEPSEIVKVDLDNILISEDRSPIIEATVEKLVGSIQRRGLTSPIIVASATDGKYPLISGAHRIEAYRRLGYTEIPCTVRDEYGTWRELIEVEENFVRNNLDTISLGELAIKRDELLTKLGYRADQSNKGKSTGAETAPLKTTADIAKEAGVSERTLQVSKQLARDLVPEAKQALRDKSITQTTAIELARLEPEEQLEALTSNDDNTSATIQSNKKSVKKRVPKVQRANTAAKSPKNIIKELHKKLEVLDELDFLFYDIALDATLRDNDKIREATVAALNKCKDLQTSISSVLGTSDNDETADYDDEEVDEEYEYGDDEDAEYESDDDVELPTA